MKIHLLSTLFFCIGSCVTTSYARQQVAVPYIPHSSADSAYIFAYSTGKNQDHNGLHFAWSQDRAMWHEIGPEHAYVKSDYGNWGPQKRMLQPSLRQTGDGGWEAIWRVNEEENVVARCTTPDLVHWIPQDYHHGLLSDYFVHPKDTLLLPTVGHPVEGEVHKVAWSVVQGLIDECQRAQRQAVVDGERIVNDKQKFPKLKSQQTSIVVYPKSKKKISEELIGIFFEDINYAADGGLYAELVQNRDFEYHPRDFRHRIKEWNNTYAWQQQGSGLSFSIDSIAPIHPHNPHYAVLRPSAIGGSVANTGFDGIVIREGEKYDFSIFSRLPNGGKGRMHVALQGTGGAVLAEATVTPGKGQWRKQNLVLKASASCDTARLVLTPLTLDTYHVDMVSLFPQKTFKGRKNGLRADLAQLLADMKPRFVRFPGGCVAHGDGLDNLYRWKNTIGPLEERVPNWNIWKYHQTLGLGYFEYFQFCEDIGAEPLPVIAAGVPCQNSCVGGYGQQNGIPMSEMEAYIQDIVDLVEWANGDPKTSSWARKRAEAGHPKPFNLKYIGIGNEDLISEVFKERFEMIYRAMKERCPEITVIGTVGPSSDGSDYEEGWRFARKLGVPMVDEHYYRSPGWFLDHQDYYDRYARGGTRVYLGEYAAHIPGRSNCLETALAEALYLCAVERNADVVAMTSYAPLLAKRGHTQWNPDLIYFTNTEVLPSTGYEVQRLFGQNSGTHYLPSTTLLAEPNGDVQRRVAVSVVLDEHTGDWILKCVNMLPVDNEISMQLPAEAPTNVKMSQILTGKIGDARLKAVDHLSVVEEGKLKVSLPAYSFFVVRLTCDSVLLAQRKG